MTTIECTLCHLPLANTTRYREHLQEAHKGIKVFACSHCDVKFEHKASLQKHIKNKHSNATGSCKSEQVAAQPEGPDDLTPAPQSTDIAPTKKRPHSEVSGVPSCTDAKTVPSAKVFFRCNQDYRDCGYMKRATTFGEWLDTYQELVQHSVNDVPMADTTKRNILQEVHRTTAHDPLLFDSLDDATLFAERVDAYVDTYFYTNIVSRVRAIRWYVRYRTSVSAATSLHCLDELDSTIAEMQSVCTIDLANRSLLAITDPYHLAQLSNQIVAVLAQHQHVYIDPFLTDYVRRQQNGTPLPSHDCMVVFGMQLRCFIELGLRFTNVPLRIQCTRGLQSWDASAVHTHVSKLVLHPGFFARSILHDKTGRTTQTISIPMCRTLSGYLLFYILHCRADPSAPHVFQAKKGGEWVTASADLKEYLQGLGIDCSAICSNGRFVHGSRHLSLAMFSILSNFEVGAIRNYAILMRHSLATIEHVYSPWLRFQQAKVAVDKMFKIRCLDNPMHARPDIPQFKVAALRTPPLDVRTHLDALFRTQFTASYPPMPSLSTATTGTQTDDTLLVPTKPRDTRLLPRKDTTAYNCDKCAQQTVLKGPFANKKKKQYYGCYYRECTTCKTCRFYELGYTPTAERSSSTKPRNMVDIEAYIRSCTDSTTSPAPVE